ncbi:C6 zinc finger domain protein [Xylogone sp. PMI_703]|nr:C6 zinc finger domain protein [Xylogone sp. PMI_703]
MDVTSNLGPSSISSPNAELSCELCSKPYQRRDLLLRHRRRCQGARKLNRRRSCDACVQAKAKCCCTQPTCSRCAKRGTRCVYAVSSGASAIVHSDHQCDVPIIADPTHQSSYLDNFATPTHPFELEIPAWDFGTTYGFESLDSALEDMGKPPAVTLPDFTATQPSMIHEHPEFTPSTQMMLLSSSSSGYSIPTSLTPSSSDSASFIATPPSSLTSFSPVRMLCRYPSLLAKGSFVSPFLHYSMYALYSNIPDMTFLPSTSMAICCGSGINMSHCNRFFRRAMDAARQRLIGTFPTSQCMQQWDALHAMLIYECLDLRESIDDEPQEWRLNPRAKGLGSPFLVKMAETYYQPYPALREPDFNAFMDPATSACTAATSQWARWRITETARRTIFFANILNFYSNRDHITGKQLPYYSSINDDLILNMPLPCNDVAWLARSEEDWKLAMQRPPSTIYHSPGFNSPGCEAIDSQITLKSIFSKFTKDYLQAEIGTNAGFDTSEELRHLIILCAAEQFA